MHDTFVQLGSSRDGRDAYRAAAARRELRTVLIETPQFIALRRAAGRPEFDSTVAVTTPSIVEGVRQALKPYKPVRLVLAGFEQYARCAHAIAAMAHFPRSNAEFHSPDKHQQRLALRQRAPLLAQPRFAQITGTPQVVDFLNFPYPAVVKPVDGGGGLGVMMVEDFDHLLRAYKQGLGLRNYDGANLPKWIIEQYVPGTESSLQGICCNGLSRVLTHCSKVVAQEPVPGLDSILGFREVAHLATSGDLLPPSLTNFAQQVVDSVAYRNGPFHIDFRNGPNGPVFLEMGFRLSGAAVTDLVHKVSGVDWGDASFGWMLGEELPAPEHVQMAAAAQMLVFTEHQIGFATQPRAGIEVSVERMTSPSQKLPLCQQQCLSADLSRHVGPIARILISGTDSQQVQQLTQEICLLNSFERTIS